MTASEAHLPSPRYRLLGVPVDLWSETRSTEAAIVAARGDRRLHFASINMNALALARRDPAMRRFYESAAGCPIDGMPVVAMARLCGIPARREHRTTYVDWIRPLLAAAAAAGVRVFHVGGRGEVTERALDILRGEFPRLEIECHHGYFDPAAGSAESRTVLEAIRRFEARLVLVGMGMPRQERWILDHRRHLPIGLALPVGACMDYVAGAIPTPPRWAGRWGLEWLFRLAAEPGRLARRYLVEPWTLLLPLLRQIVRGR